MCVSAAGFVGAARMVTSAARERFAASAWRTSGSAAQIIPPLIEITCPVM